MCGKELRCFNFASSVSSAESWARFMRSGSKLARARRSSSLKLLVSCPWNVCLRRARLACSWAPMLSVSSGASRAACFSPVDVDDRPVHALTLLSAQRFRSNVDVVKGVLWNSEKNTRKTTSLLPRLLWLWAVNADCPAQIRAERMPLLSMPACAVHCCRPINKGFQGDSNGSQGDMVKQVATWQSEPVPSCTFNSGHVPVSLAMDRI